jgi:hypothetical protein
VSSSLFLTMSFPSVRSLAAPKKLVQSLNSDTHMQRRIDITSVITDDNWSMMEQAGYADFLFSQVEKELQDPVSRILSMGKAMLNIYLLFQEYIATVVEHRIGAVLVVSKGGESKALPKLREFILQNLLTPILSRDPEVGLSSLAPGIRAQELENPSPPGVFHCIGIAFALVSAIYISLQYQPDPAFSKYVPTFLMIHPSLCHLHKLTWYSRIFEKSEALEIALLVWYYTLEAFKRNVAAGLLVQIMHGEISHAAIAYRWFCFFSGEQLAGKCKEILQDESKSDMLAA